MDILFYEAKGPYGFLSNFYLSKIEIDGLSYKSVEHYYQAQKFLETPSDLWYAHQIMDQTTGGKVFMLGNQKKKSQWPWQRELSKIVETSLDLGVKPRLDWDDIKLDVMIKGVCAKFLQNKKLKEKLLKTGSGRIIENSPRDSYWGIGLDGKGANTLGELLMTLRVNFKNDLRKEN